MLWQKLLAAPLKVSAGIIGTPTYFPMRNTATDPTHTVWQGNNVGYSFVPNDGLYLASDMTDATRMLRDNATFNDPDVAEWDMSTVTTLDQMFFRAYGFNQDISMWNTSSFLSLQEMFRSATSFNQNIGLWDWSGFTNIDQMLRDSSTFNQDLSGVCVSQFPTEPSAFSSGTTDWVLPKPVWGTCP